MKSLILPIVLALTSISAQAAITANYECKDSNGATVYWESQYGVFDKDGNVTGEYLYRNQVSINVKGIEVKLNPTKSLTSGSSAMLAAWTSDGQYVIVNANHKLKDDGDELILKGDMEFRVRSKEGILKRPEHTEVVCSMTGEA